MERVVPATLACRGIPPDETALSDRGVYDFNRPHPSPRTASHFARSVNQTLAFPAAAPLESHHGHAATASGSCHPRETLGAASLLGRVRAFSSDSVRNPRHCDTTSRCFPPDAKEKKRKKLLLGTETASEQED